MCLLIDHYFYGTEIFLTLRGRVIRGCDGAHNVDVNDTDIEDVPAKDNQFRRVKRVGKEREGKEEMNENKNEGVVQYVSKDPEQVLESEGYLTFSVITEGATGRTIETDADSEIEIQNMVFTSDYLMFFVFSYIFSYELPFSSCLVMVI